MSGSKLYVGNVPEGAKEKELQELFAAFGELEEVALMRGYGFVVSEKRALYLEFETDRNTPVSYVLSC